ncbi:MAG: AEC family transporter [Bacteroidales bacterium]|nr:AEC family transporter [Bacteroidales bacterium]MBN2634528.1 AEC family transporter [Bacteroidales bacterium]
METRIVLTQIAILAVVVIIGALAAKFKVFNNQSKDVLSKVIFNISLPLMLFTNFFRLEASPRLVVNSITVLLVTTVIIFFLLLAGWLLTKIFKIRGGEAAIFKVHSMFGNTIFLGFPLILSLFGEEGLLYASMFQLVSSILMWTVGVVIMNQGNGVSWKRSLVRVVNPNTLATVIGFALFMFSFRLPEVLLKPMSELGSANTWLSMLYIGAMLYFTNMGGMLKSRNYYIMSFSRLIMIPALLITGFYLAGALFGIVPDKLVASVVILEASMPCMVTVVIMAKEFGADDSIAVGNVFISTLLSVATLPLVVIAIAKFL